MALVVKQTKRVEHPSEPGNFFELQVPLSAGDLALMQADSTQIQVSFALMSRVVTAWPYPEPITREQIERLDLDTYMWLTQEVMAASGVTPEAEKNDSASPSSAPSDPGEADSPKSLGI